MKEEGSLYFCILRDITLLLPTTNDDPSLYEEGSFHISKSKEEGVVFFSYLSSIDLSLNEEGSVVP